MPSPLCSNLQHLLSHLDFHFLLHGACGSEQKRTCPEYIPCLPIHQHPHPLPSSLCLRRTRCANPLPLRQIQSHWTLHPAILHCLLKVVFALLMNTISIHTFSFPCNFRNHFLSLISLPVTILFLCSPLC